MRKLRAIMLGWGKYLFTDSKALIEERTALCKKCPISLNKKGNYSGWCKLKNGGCGCHLMAKAAHKESSCDLGAWGDGFTNENAIPDKVMLER